MFSFESGNRNKNGSWTEMEDFVELSVRIFQREPYRRKHKRKLNVRRNESTTLLIPRPINLGFENEFLNTELWICKF